jgi:3-oxoacyl-[acyl-carrier protein] reductase
MLPSPTDSAGAPRRVAIVTGASGGIGRDVAIRLATDGLDVVVAYGGNADAAAEVAEAIDRAGGRSLSIAADVAEPASVAALFEAAVAAFGTVDVVVHAAGIANQPTPVAELDLDVLDRVLRVNVRGTLVVLKEAASRVADGGAVITFSSSLVGLSLPGYAAYTASKAAVEATTMILARELRGRDVTVNAIAPGPTATEMFLTGKDEALIEMFAKQSPLERIGEPADVTELVAFLAGPGRWVNGQTIRINGGTV